MNGRLKYFIFNKESDYKRGYLQSMEVEGNGICAKENAGQESAFLSRVLDSRETEMSWHRFRLKGQKGKKAVFRISVYAGNERSFLYQGAEIDVDDFIRRENIGLEEKKQCLKPWLKKQASGADDLLLHEVRGRYLWFLIETYWQDGMEKLYDIQVYFPRQSWIEYLPEIYQQEDKNHFLERFLGIFQTIYEDIEERIRTVSLNFDMECASADYLAWLAQWLGIRDSYIWSEEQLRILLKNGVSMYKRRGTRKGIIDFVTLYTGERPFIVEGHQAYSCENDRKRLEQWKKLYGGSVYFFTVLIREEAAGSVWRQKTLMKIIEEIKPAHTQWALVVMKPYLFLGKYSYVGINSVLGKYTAPVLDGHSAIPFAVLGGERQPGLGQLLGQASE